jgi:hypothetical protein
MKYRLLVDLEVTEFTQRLPKRVRDELFAHLRRIRDFPSRYSDYQENDEVGRPVQIAIYAGFALHYWIDETDCHVKVLAIRTADK